jgi:hypothetical protein
MLNLQKPCNYQENINYSFLNFINRIKHRCTDDLRIFFQNNIFEIKNDPSEPILEYNGKENDEMFKLNMIEESLNTLEFNNIYKVKSLI